MSFLFNRNTGGFNHMTIPEFHQDYFNGTSDYALIDVRTTSEFRQGHLPKAINIPLDQLQNKLNKVPKNKPVIVVCATGNRSQTGARILVNAGFEDVYNLKGGTMVWMMNQYPLER